MQAPASRFITYATSIATSLYPSPADTIRKQLHTYGCTCTSSQIYELCKSDKLTTVVSINFLLASSSNFEIMSMPTSFFGSNVGSLNVVEDGKLGSPAPSPMKIAASKNTTTQTASMFQFGSPLFAYLHSSNKLSTQGGGNGSQSTLRTSLTSTTSGVPSSISTAVSELRQHQHHQAEQATFVPIDSLSNNDTEHTMSTLGVSVNDVGGIRELEPIDINDDDSICSFDVSDLEALSDELAACTPIVAPHPLMSQMNSSTASLNRAFENMHTRTSMTQLSSVNTGHRNNINGQGNMSCPSFNYSMAVPKNPTRPMDVTNGMGSVIAGGSVQSNLNSVMNCASFQGNTSCPSFNFDPSSCRLGGGDDNHQHGSVSSFNTMPSPASSSFNTITSPVSSSKRVLSSSRLRTIVPSRSSTSSMNGRRSSSSSMNGRRRTKHELPGKNAAWTTKSSSSTGLDTIKRKTKRRSSSSRSSSSSKNQNGSKSKGRCKTYSGLILSRVNSKKSVVKDLPSVDKSSTESPAEK